MLISVIGPSASLPPQIMKKANNNQLMHKTLNIIRCIRSVLTEGLPSLA
jgi:hypothetical protein